MPKPLNVDWSLVHGLLLQGFNCSQVGDQTGIKPDTIRKQAHRRGWLVARDKVRSVLVQTGLSRPVLAIQASQLSKSLIQASDSTRQDLSGELSGQLSVLSAKPARRLSDLANTSRREGRTSVVQRIVATAAKLYGWDQQTGQPLPVNLTQVNISGPTDSSTPVIDLPDQPD